MKLRLISTAFAVFVLFPVTANAQVTIDMAALTCSQYLAMSPSTSRDFSAWMSGWYSYQTRRTFVDVLADRKKYRELQIVVPIPSASKRNGGLAERDRPAVTFWTLEKAIRWNVLFVAVSLLMVVFAAKCCSD